MLGNMRMLRGGVSRTIGLMTALAAVCASAQTHKVSTPQQVVRAVGVYEWTGDITKPTASRLIPVTVFIDGKLEDAGVYLARPVPFALLNGNLYELQSAGIPRGALELSFAKHLQAIDTATGASQFDDGWFGYGNYHAPAAPKKAPALVASKTVSQIKSSKDDDGKPHFANKTGSDSGSGAAGSTASSDGGAKTDSSGGSKSDSSADSNSGGSTPAGDPDRPTMRRRSGNGSDNSGAGNSSGSSTGSSAGKSSGPVMTDSAPVDDPDRPRLQKRSGSDSGTADPQSGSASGTTASGSDSGSGGGSGQSGSTGNSGTGSSGTGSSDTGSSGTTTSTAGGGSSEDPDRPTLKRRSPEEMKKQGQKEASASVRPVGSLNDDPDRPTLQHGKPANAMKEADLPPMKGLPMDLHQMVGVSDAVNRDPHDFARPWEDDGERAAILAKMQVLARAKLKEYAAISSGAAAASPATAKTAAGPAKPATTAAAAAAAAARRKAAAAPTPPPVELQEESLKGYTLSYGGAATYVYTAHTPGAGATLQYVTIVAQADPQGELKPAIQSATDAAHFDRTPRMRLVDAVDVEASNRASLLFELRGEKSRQFGVYRVIGARAEETFSTGTTQ